MFQFLNSFIWTGIITLNSLGTPQGDIDNLRQWFAQGDATAIGNQMHSSIQLLTPQSDGYYSKAQATMIISRFFQSHSPKSCTINSQGSSDNGAYYAILKLETSNGNYRVSLFMKKGATGLEIQELKIEP
jgi:hypothetical protein